jgi:bacterioferritin-associated ferredoxin
MYLCICNAITDRQARSHGTTSGGTAGCSVAAFYRALGVKPKCGKCVRGVREMLDAKAESSEARQDTSGVERQSISVFTGTDLPLH